MPQNILLIQNDSLDAAATHEALVRSVGEPFHFEWARSLATGFDSLTRSTRQPPPAMPRITAILLDLRLPDCCGIASFDHLFQAATGIPILILNTAPEDAVARLAVRHGAQNYIVKAPLDACLLGIALSNMVECAAHAETLFREKEHAQVTPGSIDAALVSKDLGHKVTNPLAG
jgi:CheY-like chemotaxis protein